MLVRLFTTYNCYSSRGEWLSQTTWPRKPKVFNHLALYRKSWLTPGLAPWRGPPLLA